jgi:hypothetical protein
MNVFQNKQSSCKCKWRTLYFLRILSGRLWFLLLWTTFLYLGIRPLVLSSASFCVLFSWINKSRDHNFSPFLGGQTWLFVCVILARYCSRHLAGILKTESIARGLPTPPLSLSRPIDQTNHPCSVHSTNKRIDEHRIRSITEPGKQTT